MTNQRPANLCILVPFLSVAGMAGPRAVAEPKDSGSQTRVVAAESERLVFLLEYIRVDYDGAVRGQEIVDPFEYQEMRDFSQLLVDRFDKLRNMGASERARERNQAAALWFPKKGTFSPTEAWSPTPVDRACPWAWRSDHPMIDPCRNRT